MQSGPLEPGDLDLVAALQIAPRAGVRLLADVLGVSPATVSKRLARLRERHALRIVGQGPWSLGSDATPYHVWIATRPGWSDAVAEAITELDEAQFVAVTAGRADVYCILHPFHRSDGAALLGTRLPAIDGIVRTRAELGLRRYFSGSGWRLRRLDAEQEAQLAEHRQGPLPKAAEVLGPDEVRVAGVLRHDGRSSTAEIARQLGMSASTAYRVTQSLLSRGLVQPRVEIEPAVLGYPLEVVLSTSTAPGSMEDVARALSDLPSARYVTTVAGTSSVIHQALFRHEDDLADFLSQDLGRQRGVTTFEISVVLRVLTRYWSKPAEPGAGRAGVSPAARRPGRRPRRP
ncbi:Lrp/AsnC family transcriptional regulator [Georgenia alba]|uniref:Lrp/AsnC family transcriptional regulator n=1 Tax=Georgenia alba TaxID=2233858 RepID=A0ABW2Q644_9MICO